MSHGFSYIRNLKYKQINEMVTKKKSECLEMEKGIGGWERNRRKRKRKGTKMVKMCYKCVVTFPKCTSQFIYCKQALIKRKSITESSLYTYLYLYPYISISEHINIYPYIFKLLKKKDKSSHMKRAKHMHRYFTSKTEMNI